MTNSFNSAEATAETAESYARKTMNTQLKQMLFDFQNLKSLGFGKNGGSKFKRSGARFFDDSRRNEFFKAFYKDLVENKLPHFASINLRYLRDWFATIAAKNGVIEDIYQKVSYEKPFVFFSHILMSERLTFTIAVTQSQVQEGFVTREWFFRNYGETHSDATETAPLLAYVKVIGGGSSYKKFTINETDDIEEICSKKVSLTGYSSTDDSVFDLGDEPILILNWNTVFRNLDGASVSDVIYDTILANPFLTLSENSQKAAAALAEFQSNGRLFEKIPDDVYTELNEFSLAYTENIQKVKENFKLYKNFESLPENGKLFTKIFNSDIASSLIKEPFGIGDNLNDVLSAPKTLNERLISQIVTCAYRELEVCRKVFPEEWWKEFSADLKRTLRTTFFVYANNKRTTKTPKLINGIPFEEINLVYVERPLQFDVVSDTYCLAVAVAKEIYYLLSDCVNYHLEKKAIVSSSPRKSYSGLPEGVQSVIRETLTKESTSSKV